MQGQPYQQVHAVSVLYEADQLGVVRNVAPNDVAAMRAAGFEPIGLVGAHTLVGRLIGANFNAIGDQPIATWTVSPFRVTRVVVRNASLALTGAQGGIYTAPAQGGEVIVPLQGFYGATQSGDAIAALAVESSPIAPVLAAGAMLYFNLSTAQGAPATADLAIYGEVGGA